MWSTRFRPTPGRSWATATPTCSSSRAGPIPESSSSFGESTAPADTRPVPAGVARERPAVVVGAGAAQVDHAVEAARPAEDLAARPGVDAIAGVLLRHGAVAPVGLGTPEDGPLLGVVDLRALVP